MSLKKVIVKKVTAYLLILIISVTSVFGSYSQSVRASAVLPVAFAVEEVIGTVLSLLGIKFAWDAAGTAVENWDKYTEWAGGLREDILNTWQKAYNADVYKQLAKEFDRALDSGLTGLITISGNVWDALKDWAGGIYDSLNPSVTAPYPAIKGTGCAFILNRTFQVSTSVRVQYNAITYDFTENVERICGYEKTDGDIWVYGSLKKEAYTGTTTNDFQKSYHMDGVKKHSENKTVFNRLDDLGIYYLNDVFIASYYGNAYVDFKHAFPMLNSAQECLTYVSTGVLPDTYTKPNVTTGETETSDVTTVDGVNKLYERDKAIGAYDVLTPGRVIGDAGTVTGDVTVDTAKEDAIAGVWAGDIPWVDFMDNIGAIPIDITTDLVIDKDDGASGDEKIEDKYTPPIAPPADMDSFTANLQEIFPFCIPFDLIKAVKILTSEPVPPKYTFKIQVKQLKIDYDIVIDFEKYEDLAKIIRVLMTFAFVIMLILLTRNIIRG